MKRTQQTIISLLNASLFEKKSVDIDLTKKEWKRVYSYSKKGGVAGICYDALCKLPEFMHPDQELYTRWTSRYHRIIERYDKRERSYQILCKAIESQDLHGVVFKGLTISKMYPYCKLREYGDIDILLFGDFYENEEKLHAAGLTSTHPSRRHSHIRINNVVVENHHHILFNRNGAEHLIDIWLQEQATQGEEKIGALNVLPPLAKAVQFIMHTAHHFSGNDCNIKLRYITDWAMFLKAGGFDYTEMRSRLEPAGGAKFADALTLICNKWFDCVPADIMAKTQPVSDKVLNKLEKAIFDKKYQRKDERRFVARMLGHLRKAIVYHKLKSIKLK